MEMAHSTSTDILSSEPEPDFAPAVSAPREQHPVPTSHDGGATLDWGGPHFDDESTDAKKKTSGVFNLHRRKGKTKSTAGAEQQTSHYSDTLARIKSLSSPQTLRKAAIVASQLSRRYALTTPGFNPLKALKWHNIQPDAVRSSFAQREPTTWTRHLPSTPNSALSNWTVTALVAEEHIRSSIPLPPPPMTPIPEDHPSPPPRAHNPTKSLSLSTPSTPHRRPRPVSLLEPSLARRRSGSGGSGGSSIERSVSFSTLR